jgi:DNA-binding response OmpR family regulator
LGNLATETAEQSQLTATSHFQAPDNFTVSEAQVRITEPTVILLVEDNADVRDYLKMNLSSYEVIEANNGVEGYEKAIETIPDLIISDVMMPGMDGLQFCRKVKTDERTSHIPVILLTARQSDQFQEEGYETGADDYIIKPFRIGLVLVRIKNLLESRKKLRELFNRETGFNPRLAGTNATDKAFLAKATSLIEENMSNEGFNVEWLAAQMFLSRSQLYRKIKALTNQSVQDFVNTIRLNKAATLLMDGSLSVSEIAFMAGYADSTTFGRSFQKQFGETPKKFSQKGKTQLP